MFTLQTISILLLTPYERGYKLGQGLGIFLIIGIVALIYFRRKKKRKQAEAQKENILDK